MNLRRSISHLWTCWLIQKKNTALFLTEVYKTMTATLFQVSNTSDGYVVKAFVYMTDRYRQWKPLRNFGDRQSDALEFCHHDCSRLSEQDLSLLIKNYKVENKYTRISENRFKRTVEL